MLSKIQHKKWENYVVNRIIHRLDDPEIEFVCQQYVARSTDKHALVDLYFPQFNISLEVDEPQHEQKKHKVADSDRTDEIVAAIGCDERRLSVQRHDKSTISLDELHTWVDAFVAELRNRKAETGDRFIPWDYENRYDPQTHIRRGYIDVDDNVAFQNHRDALACFGYSKGHYQQAVWTIPGTNKWVWFPKFYKNDQWDNSRSVDGTSIYEKYLGVDPKGIGRRETVDSRIVFAHDRDALGYTLYRYVGEYRHDPSASDDRTNVFRLSAKRIDLAQYSN
ncbi:MAG: hypothetical protein KDK28_21160 [Maritimibacter sp.]|nr:hypothetical protein [Maritimibacter sp.]